MDLAYCKSPNENYISKFTTTFNKFISKHKEFFEGTFIENSKKEFYEKMVAKVMGEAKEKLIDEFV
jgi:hypothetical protein